MLGIQLMVLLLSSHEPLIHIIILIPPLGDFLLLAGAGILEVGVFVLHVLDLALGVAEIAIGLFQFRGQLHDLLLPVSDFLICDLLAFAQPINLPQSFFECGLCLI